MMKKPSDQRVLPTDQNQPNNQTNLSDDTDLLGRLGAGQAEKLAKHWFKCPPSAITNMFYTYYEENEMFFNQRAVTYKVPFLSLRDLIGVYTNARNAGKNCELKVFMGCDTDFKEGEIMEGAPGFCPFVQLYIIEDQKKNPGYQHSYKCNFRKRSTIPLTDQAYFSHTNNSNKPTGHEVSVDDQNNPSHVSPHTAHLFLKEWCLAPNSEMPGLFTGIVYGQIARVNSYIFSQDDLEEIVELWSQDPSSNLYVHMAVIKPLTHSPFGFHIVLEVGPHTVEPLDATQNAPRVTDGDDDGGNFFEFGTPCPPFCQKPGGGDGG